MLNTLSRANSDRLLVAISSVYSEFIEGSFTHTSRVSDYILRVHYLLLAGDYCCMAAEVHLVITTLDRHSMDATRGSSLPSTSTAFSAGILHKLLS